MTETREPPRRVQRRRLVAPRQRCCEVVQRRPALADEQIAEERRADRVGESRGGRSHDGRARPPRRRVHDARARQQRPCEERAAGEVIARGREPGPEAEQRRDRKSTRLNSSHSQISYAVFCLKKKKKDTGPYLPLTT